MNHKPSITRRIYELAQRANGVSSPEIAKATGIPNSEVHGHIRWMRDSGKLTRKRVSEGRTKSRFFADPAVSLDVLVRTRSEQVRASKERQVAASNQAVKAGVKPTSGARAVVEWRVIDGRRVKVTVCPASHDTRFTANPSDVAPLFGCLGFGRYLQRDSAIARAYGSRA